LCQVARSGIEERITEKTGLLIDPYFSGTKIAWLLDNVPGARARAERGELAFGTVDTWLVWQLTNGAVHVTDVSNASRTLLLSLHTLDWDEELLQLLKVPRSMLPRLVPSSDVIASSAPEIFGAPVKIAGIAGDQQAATFGQACFAPGMAKNTYGTGCFMLMNSGTHRGDRAIGCYAPSAGSRRERCGHVLPRRQHLCRRRGGAVVARWAGFFASSSEVEALAAQVPDNGGVYSCRRSRVWQPALGSERRAA